MVVRQMTVQAGISFSLFWRNNRAVIAFECFGQKFRGMTDSMDTPNRKAWFLNGLAERGVVFIGKKLIIFIAEIEDPRQPILLLSYAEAQAQRTNGEVIPPHSKPVLPIPPGMPAINLTRSSRWGWLISSTVCITAGRNGPFVKGCPGRVPGRQVLIS